MRREESMKWLALFASLSVLTGCASNLREGPPAPVVQATPRISATSPRTVAEPPRELEEVQAPELEPKPVRPKKPVKPAKAPTRVFAYKDPSREPDPEPPLAAAAAEPVPGAAAPASGSGQSPAGPGSAAEGAQAASAAPGVPSRPAAPSSTQPGSAQPGAAPAAAAPQQAVGQMVAKAEPQVAMPSAPPAPEAPRPSPLPESTLAAPNMPPAAGTLASQAEQQRQSGDYSGAAASLERSLRISPREPYLWNRLARVRMEQGQSAQAGNLAARSNDLAGQNPDVKKDNWRIIAESKRRAGDVAGAAEAEQRAGAD